MVCRNASVIVAMSEPESRAENTTPACSPLFSCTLLHHPPRHSPARTTLRPHWLHSSLPHRASPAGLGATCGQREALRLLPIPGSQCTEPGAMGHTLGFVT